MCVCPTSVCTGPAWRQGGHLGMVPLWTCVSLSCRTEVPGGKLEVLSLVNVAIIPAAMGVYEYVYVCMYWRGDPGCVCAKVPLTWAAGEVGQAGAGS